jgi:hypothetical protein
MGSTMCKGGSLQYTLQLNQKQTTQTPKIKNYLQDYTSLQQMRYTRYTNIQRYKIYKEI